MQFSDRNGEEGKRASHEGRHESVSGRAVIPNSSVAIVAPAIRIAVQGHNACVDPTGTDGGSARGRLQRLGRANRYVRSAELRVVSQHSVVSVPPTVYLPILRGGC